VNNNYWDGLFEKLPQDDVAVADLFRETSKAVLDILKNLILLGALKVFALKSNSMFAEIIFWVGMAAFVWHGLSYVQVWRVRLLSAGIKTAWAQGVDILLNALGLAALHIFLIVEANRLAVELATMQSR
jgi:hypothetical protein